MSVWDWVANSSYYVTQRGYAGGAKMAAGELLSGGIRRVYPYLPQPGTPVFERAWDALVVLDACRVDALAEVSAEYDFLPTDIPAVTSVGTNSREWMRHTFADAYADCMTNTVYVTFNPHSKEELSSDDFLLLEEVWQTDWEVERGGVPANAVTDRAIVSAREYRSHWERLIVHYKQPHAPYPELEGFDASNRIEATANDRSGVFGALIEGTVSHEAAWNAYLDHLRNGLDSVAVLLENLDAETVVITADHGECFGEWGLYGHHPSTPVPELIRVPWVETTATDTGTRRPAASLQDDHDLDIEDKLRALGYR